MTDNEITREKTFSEELPYFKERIKEVFDNYDNPNGYEDPLYIAVLRDSKRIVRKAEEEIARQQATIDEFMKETAVTTLIDDAVVYTPTLEDYNKFKKTFKSEAVKEFAEKLKKRIYKGGVHPTVEDEFMCDIDNLIKETVGDSE